MIGLVTPTTGYVSTLYSEQSYTQTDQVITWFWQILGSWPAEKKSRQLQFM